MFAKGIRFIFFSKLVSTRRLRFIASFLLDGIQFGALIYIRAYVLSYMIAHAIDSLPGRGCHWFHYPLVFITSKFQIKNNIMAFNPIRFQFVSATPSRRTLHHLRHSAKSNIHQPPASPHNSMKQFCCFYFL